LPLEFSLIFLKVEPESSFHKDNAIPTNYIRREFIQASTASLIFPAIASAIDSKPINVVVWDERQPAQKQAYDKFLGNQTARVI